MFDLYDNEEGSLIGQVSEEQLQFLVDSLEETHATDKDYYLDLATLDMLEEDGGDEALLRLLRSALGEREAMEIRWEEAG